MPEQEQSAILRVNAPRSGSVQEGLAFLAHLEAAYDQIHMFFRFVDLFDPESERFRRRFRLWYDIGLPPYLSLSPFDCLLI